MKKRKDDNLKIKCCSCGVKLEYNDKQLSEIIVDGAICELCSSIWNEWNWHGEHGKVVLKIAEGVEYWNA